MHFCTKCGKENYDSAKFCTSCGEALRGTDRGQSSNSKKHMRLITGTVIAIVLSTCAWFLFFNKPRDRDKESSVNKNVLADDIPALKEVVQQWSAALNRGSATEVSALYTERLVYYGSAMSKENAKVLLTNFLMNNTGFYQQISSEITIERINDNMVVCNFQKTATLNGKSTDYPSYLKLAKESGSWKIVEEGDKITDYNLGKRK